MDDVKFNSNYLAKPICPEMIVLVGLSGCGKSTFAKEFVRMKSKNGRAYTIISSDEIRKELTGNVENQQVNEEVFNVVHRRMKESLRANKSVIIDATNLALKNRRAYFNCVKKIPCIKICYIFNVPISMCIERQQNEDRELHLSEEILKRMEMKFEIPFMGEGWDAIHFVDKNGKVIHNYDFDSKVKIVEDITTIPMFKEQVGFNQKNRHHLYTLDEHSRRVAQAVRDLEPPNLVKTNKSARDDWYGFIKNMLIKVAYLHDYGKMFVGVPKDDGSGDYKYFNHHNVGAYRIMNNMEQLGIDDIDSIAEFLFYVNYHMQPFFINTPKAEDKWKEIFGEWNYEILTFFNKCDIIGSGTRDERVGVN